MRRLLLVLSAVLMLTLVPGMAIALTDQPASLTVVLEYGSAPLSGMEVAVCQVAHVTEEVGILVYRPTTAFTDANPDFRDLTRAKNIALAARLDTHARSNSIERSKLTTDATGKAHFQRLEPGLYLVALHDVEKATHELEPYLVAVPNPHETRDGYDYDVIAYPKTELRARVTPTVSISVVKVWAGSGTHPASVKVRLLKNGQPHGSDITLNAANSWRHVWKDLSAEDTWTVDEPTVPTGYTKKVTGSATGGGFTITNTKAKAPDPPVDPKKPPVTGEPTKPANPTTPKATPRTSDAISARTIALLCAIGLGGFVVVVTLVKRRQGSDEDASRQTT